MPIIQDQLAVEIWKEEDDGKKGDAKRNAQYNPNVFPCPQVLTAGSGSSTLAYDELFEPGR